VNLDVAYEKLVAVDPLTLPPAIRSAMLAPPLFVVPLRASAAGFEAESWVGVPEIAPRNLFPKLAIKSWRDGGSLQLIARGMPLRPVVEQLLSHPTAPQQAIARAWEHQGLPLKLYLFPFVDFSDVSEARWLAEPTGVSFISACRRGTSARHLGSALTSMCQFADGLAKQLPPRTHILELGLFPSGEIHLVEVNPALQPLEVDAVLKAA
jgi:hypothetical protein